MRKSKDRQPRGLSVEVRDNNISGALSILKKLINEDGLKKEMKKREFHVTKNQQRRKDKAAAIRRFKKMKQENQEF
jgi:small subunit ribosomal protein S21